MDPGARAGRVGLPRSFVAAVGLLLALNLAQLWPETQRLFVYDRADPFGRTGAFVIAIFYAFFVPLLVGVGLSRRSRLVHVLGAMWILSLIALGVFNLVQNGYSWKAVRNVRQVAFFHGALPATAGTIALILFVLPPSIRWIYGSSDESRQVVR